MNEPVDRIDNRVESVESTFIEDIDTNIRVESIPLETDTTAKTDVRVEEFSLNGDALVAKVRELIDQGNIRRIIVKNEEGRVLIEIPLTVGVVGGAIGVTLFPVIAAVGAIGALVAHLTIAIEKVE